ncbi:MAG: rod shape-determining protein RodA [Chloroflexi bacterium]|nr:rod shape-determining protein RodA [Chloroflexota bacterium]
MKFLEKFHIPLILAVLLLSGLGLVMIQSVTGEGGKLSSELIHQAAYIILGLFLMVVCLGIDYDFWGRISGVLYLIIMTLLILVLFIGSSALGAQRWISLGPLGSFQPSEFAKLVMIIIFARALSDWESSGDVKILVRCLVMLLPMLGLIVVQPDLGTALVFIFVAFGMMFSAGVKPLLLLGTAALGLAAAPFVLKDYQKKRLFVFLNPEHDPQGAGWNVIQSKIAVGSGGLLGKGIGGGTQTQLHFVPENHTDFIHSALAEEMGFGGSFGMLLLFFYIMWQCIKISENARDTYGRFLAIGVFWMLLFHVLINVGMTMGIMPVTGIPLPFISYGGSSMLTNFMAVGLVLSVYLRREKMF